MNNQESFGQRVYREEQTLGFDSPARHGSEEPQENREPGEETMFTPEELEAANEMMLDLATRGAAMNELAQKARELAAKYPKLTISMVGSWIWFVGDTKRMSRSLKKEGARWSKKSKRWYLMGLPIGNRKGATS